MFVTTFHKNISKINSFVVLSSVTNESRGSSVRLLASQYEKLLKLPHQLNEEERIRIDEYVRSRSLSDKYPRQDKTKRSGRTLNKHSSNTVEIQDWYLSDPELSSSAGTERSATVGRTVELAASLGLLRLPGGTLQTMGKILKMQAEKSGILPFSDNLPRNPFAPAPQLWSIALYCLLKYDASFVFAILKQFKDGPSAFYSGFGPKYVEILADVERIEVRTMANRQMFIWLDKQKAFAKRLVSVLAGTDASVKKETAYRPAEDALLSRSELLHDCGILQKASPTDNTYQLTDCGLTLLKNWESRKFTLEDDYYANMNSLFAAQPLKGDSDEIVSHIWDAYVTLRNPARYAPIEETVLLANSESLRIGTNRCVEVGEARNALQALAREPNSPVRIVADRLRRPSSFRHAGAKS